MGPRRKPDILQRTIVAQSRLFCVEAIDLTFSNGEERQYERLIGQHQAGAVMICPVLDKDTFLLVREYAAGVDAYELALPKGLVEPGEDLLDAANREMKEEVGYGARDLRYIRSLSMSPGYSSSKMPLVLAQDLYPERLEGDEPEPIEVVPWKFCDLDKLMMREDCSEARTIAALYIIREILYAKAL